MKSGYTRLPITLMVILVLSTVSWQSSIPKAQAQLIKYEITIDNTQNPNTLTDYQVLLQVNNDPNFFGNITDPNQIEIYDYDKTTPLSFWIEEWDNVNYNAKIWIKVPNIPGGQNKTIYLAINTGRTTPLSNGDSTFLLFDDFDGADVDPNKWSIQNQGGASYSVSNSMILLSSPSGTDTMIFLESIQTFNYPIRIIVYGKAEGNYDETYASSFIIKAGTGTAFSLQDGFHSDYTTYSNYGLQLKEFSGGSSINSAYLGQTWYIKGTFEIHELAFTSSFVIRKGASYSVSFTPSNDFTLQNNKVWIGTNNWASGTGTLNQYYDWVAVAKYSSPEPAVSYKYYAVSGDPLGITVNAVIWTKENIVLNPGFETGDFSNWTLVSGGNVYDSSISPGPHSGTYYAKIYYTTTGGVAQIYQTFASDYYAVFGFWVGVSGDSAYIYIQDDAGTWTLVDTISPTAAWTQKEYTLTGRIRGIKFLGVSSSTIIYLDDVYVYLLDMQTKVLSGTDLGGGYYEYSLSVPGNSYKAVFIIPSTWDVVELRNSSGAAVPYQTRIYNGGEYKEVIIGEAALATYGSTYILRVYDGSRSSYPLSIKYVLDNVPPGSYINISDSGLEYIRYGNVNVNVSSHGPLQASDEAIMYLGGPFSYVWITHLDFTATLDNSTLVIYIGFSDDNVTYTYYYAGEVYIRHYVAASVEYVVPPNYAYQYVSVKFVSYGNSFTVIDLVATIFHGQTLIENSGGETAYVWRDNIFGSIAPGSSLTLTDYIYDLRIAYNITYFKIKVLAEETGDKWNITNSQLIFKYWNGSTIVEEDLGPINASTGDILYYSITGLGLDPSTVAKKILTEPQLPYFMHLNVNGSVWRAGQVDLSLTANIYIHYPLYPTIIDYPGYVIAKVKTLTLKLVSSGLYRDTVDVYLAKGTEYYIELYDPDTYSYIGTYYTKGGSIEAQPIVKVTQAPPSASAPIIPENSTVPYPGIKLPDAIKAIYDYNPTFATAAYAAVLLIILITAGSFFGGVAIIVASILGMMINYTLGIDLFNRYMLGIFLFLGILSIAYEYRVRRR